MGGYTCGYGIQTYPLRQYYGHSLVSTRPGHKKHGLIFWTLFINLMIKAVCDLGNCKRRKRKRKVETENGNGKRKREMVVTAIGT